MVPPEVDDVLDLEFGAAHVMVAIAGHYVHLGAGHREAVGLVTTRELAAEEELGNVGKQNTDIGAAEELPWSRVLKKDAPSMVGRNLSDLRLDLK